MIVLDLDMDYFLDVVPTHIDEGKRQSRSEYVNGVWDKCRVRSFMENNLGLSKEKRIPGRLFTRHNEVLDFWTEQLKKGKLSDPFEVVHVDSHADLGLGCASYDFLQSDYLSKTIEERRKIKKYTFNGNDRGISEIDYLLWAVAYKMVSKITYCANPTTDKNDYHVVTLKDFKEEQIGVKTVSNYIQLKYIPNRSIPEIGRLSMIEKDRLLGIVKVDNPPVELQIIPTIEEVNYSGEFVFATMAQSPEYTPANADYIMDVFREYIDEE